MVTLSLTRLAAVICGLALSLTAAPGVASAAPDPGSIVNSSSLINTTCSYRQVVTAIAARSSPADYSRFNTLPWGREFVQGFVRATPDERQPMVASIMTTPQAWRSRGVLLEFLVPAVDTCYKY